MNNRVELTPEKHKEIGETLKRERDDVRNQLDMYIQMVEGYYENAPQTEEYMEQKEALKEFVNKGFGIQCFYIKELIQTLKISHAHDDGIETMTERYALIYHTFGIMTMFACIYGEKPSKELIRMMKETMAMGKIIAEREMVNSIVSAMEKNPDLPWV